MNFVLAQNLNISATIEGTTIYGYTSPNSKVLMDLRPSSKKSKAYKDGYFQFNLASNLGAQEVCLSSSDDNKRSTKPVCIALSGNKLNNSIGPIILPPTLSLNKNTYYLADNAYLSGRTMPNTDVFIYIFLNERTLIDKVISKLSIFRPVYAMTFPTISLRSNNKGDFSISLPSHQIVHYRILSQASFKNELSAQSHSLSLSIYPYWIYIKDNIIFITIILEIVGLLTYVIKKYLHPYATVKTKALMLKNDEAIILKSKFDAFIKEEKASIMP